MGQRKNTKDFLTVGNSVRASPRSPKVHSQKSEADELYDSQLLNEKISIQDISNTNNINVTNVNSNAAKFFARSKDLNNMKFNKSNTLPSENIVQNFGTNNIKVVNEKKQVRRNTLYNIDGNIEADYKNIAKDILHQEFTNSKEELSYQNFS